MIKKKVVLSVLSTAVVTSMAASALAAPKAGIYIGGDVDKYYSFESLTNSSNVDKLIDDLIDTSANGVYVNQDGVGGYLADLLFAENPEEQFETVTNDYFAQIGGEDGFYTVNEDGTVSDTKEPADPDNPVNGELKVESVSAINAKQIEVKFDSKVDATSAEDEGNYYVQRNTDASAVKLTTLDANAKAEVQADGKTVIITTSSAIETTLGVSAGTPFKFIVNGVENEAGKVAPKFEQVLTVNDTTAPTFVSASASAKTTTNKITLKFSEPVDPTSGVVKVNGVAASVGAGSAANELTVTTGNTLTAGQTYSLEIISFKDYAGNLLSPNKVNASVTVAGDVAAPVVTSVKVVSDNAIEVTFDKAMDPSTLTAGNIRLLDGNSTNLVNNFAAPVAKDSTNKVFTIAIDNNPALPFNNNVFNGTLVLTDSIKDAAGNNLVTTSKPVTITKDLTAPAVASMKFVKADSAPGANYGGVSLANGVIAIKYNEKVAKSPTASATGIVVIDNNGTDVTSTYINATAINNAAINANDNTELVIPLQGSVPAGTTSLTFRFPGNLVVDDSLTQNKDAAFVKTVQVESGTVVTDTTAPVVTSVTGGAGNVINIAVTEANALDAGTVQDLNNYRLDGAPLPEGTYAEITGTAPNFVVKLHLPEGSISTTRSNYVVNVSGLKDKAGNTMTAFAANTVALTDDVKPELTSATLNSDGTISLGFSETLAVGPDADDLVVTINGSELQVGANTAYTAVLQSSGADAGKSVVTVSTSYDAGTDVDGDTSNDGDGDEKLYIDVDADGTFNSAVDILVATGTFTSANAGTFNLNSPLVTSLKVATAPTPDTAKDTANNFLKGDTEKVIR